MPWSIVTKDWTRFVQSLCSWFPYFDETAVQRFRGDRAKLVVYLAESHDLTEDEASEQLEDWFALQGRIAWSEAEAA